MRLLHTTTFKLREVDDYISTAYAILSHTWGQSETTLQDIQNCRHVGDSNDKNGKVRNSSAFAAAAGLEYIWIDTCCIDKTNSVELSEAINSMYRWYKESAICVAYLEDFAPHDEVYITNSPMSRSRWFTRGWTLQELIAPVNLVFLNSQWQRIGNKLEILTPLSKITGIPERFLVGDNLELASVAQRMSWAAGRETSRMEDMAYCLLGIFNLHLPLLYGERFGAFQRLQEEIMRKSDDDSILAWSGDRMTSPSGDTISGNNWHFRRLFSRRAAILSDLVSLQSKGI